MTTPVVFIIYNRPDKTLRSFEAIRSVQPAILYIIGDGPKNEQDAQLVSQTRQIVEKIDWTCQVHRIYAQENLSCGHRISSGLDSVFSECDKAIIIEDDIITSPAFFDFCSYMLEIYENDSRMMAVTGWNGLVTYQSELYNAFFSKYSSIWGWATWRRAWRAYQFEPDWPLDQFDERLQAYFRDSFRPKLQRHNYINRIWQRYQTWDIQWALTIYMHDGLVITPTVNLCQNIGFDAQGTHLTSFNLRGLFPIFSPHPNFVSGTVKEEYGPENDWYDYSILLLNIFSLYQDIRKLLLVYKNPQLLPRNRDNTGWECTLQPLNEPERCLQILTHLEAYIAHPDLDKCKSVFQRLIQN
ncbi:hypothetical protein [Spirosoma sp. KNUC1025]|uniref:hypothetical protein n=1 Tax=Spirosoma sp. KNUC1025 TaxID=2894082 RepID=UPI00386B65AC|nr:hypothetical protein LN737_17915 [Spirosoma sp. KNUC1025]